MPHQYSAKSVHICILVVLITAFIKCIQADYQVNIDTESELEAIGGSTECSYVEQFSQICKTGLQNSINYGYWSSCRNPACEISLPIGGISGTVPPSELELLTFVNGDNAQIRLRYRLTPTSPFRNLFPDVSQSTEWIKSTYDLARIAGLNHESEIFLLLSSGSLSQNADIIDSISFTVPGERPTTSVAPDSTTTPDADTTTTEVEATSKFESEESQESIFRRINYRLSKRSN